MKRIFITFIMIALHVILLVKYANAFDESERLIFHANPIKDTFYIGEPIIINFSLINIDNDNITFMMEANDIYQKYSIIVLSGKSDNELINQNKIYIGEMLLNEISLQSKDIYRESITINRWLGNIDIGELIIKIQLKIDINDTPISLTDIIVVNIVQNQVKLNMIYEEYINNIQIGSNAERQIIAEQLSEAININNTELILKCFDRLLEVSHNDSYIQYNIIKGLININANETSEYLMRLYGELTDDAYQSIICNELQRRQVDYKDCINSNEND